MSAGQPRPEPPRIVLDDLYVLDRPRAEDAAANRRFALDTDAARFLGWTVDQARSLPDAHYGEVSSRFIRGWETGAPLPTRPGGAGRLTGMALELYMVGVIVANMGRAVEFYRRLGLEISEGSEKQEHVEVKMGEMTFFLSTRRANAKWDPAARDPSGGYRIILEFYLETREALDAKYAEMADFGYEPHCAPYDVTPDLRFAMVDDPDGNTILLSASTATDE